MGGQVVVEPRQCCSAEAVGNMKLHDEVFFKQKNVLLILIPSMMAYRIFLGPKRVPHTHLGPRRYFSTWSFP